MPHGLNAPVEPGPGDIVIASLSQARKHKRRFDAVITVEDPGCRPANRLRFNRKPFPAHLILAFEDVDDDTLGVRVATSSQVADAIAFARAHASGALLVHCFHGVGRSAGVGLAILADRAGKGQEGAALNTLLRLRPGATPNLVVVKLADELLGRGGALVDAVASWEAITPDVRERRQARLKMVHSNPQAYSWLSRE